MCGRYTIIAKAEEIERQFKVEVPEFYIPNYNAAPTQALPVITNQNREHLSFFKWGYPLPNSHADTKAPFIINTRTETLQNKQIFKKTLENQRCLVIADSFYEWKKQVKGIKIPYRFITDPENLMAFAGIWEETISEDYGSLHSFSIITTPANNTVKPLHDRMPAILTNDMARVWLDNDVDILKLLDVLKPFPASKTICYPVSKRVNSIKNNDPEIIKPTPPTGSDGSLFLFE